MAARFSASSAAQFMACPGSANLELAIPGWTPPVVDKEAGAKGRGTLAHDFLAQALTDFTLRELEGFVLALDYVTKLKRTRRFKQLVEESFTADWLPSRPTTTIDLALYVQDELHIIDYKFGRIPVDPTDNPQGLFYALTLAHLAPKAKGATIHIIQPLIEDGISSWYASADVLEDFLIRAVDTDKKILAGDTTLTPSDNCTFCPANPHSRGDKGRPLCPAMLQLLYPSSYDEAEILGL